MDTLLTIVHVLVCLFLVGIVLLQHGKGADIGATFGGSSQSLFGTEGPLPLLNKITTAVAIIFMLTSVSLAYISSQSSTSSVMSGVSTSTPAIPAEAVKPQPLAKKDVLMGKPPAEEQKAAETAQPVAAAKPEAKPADAAKAVDKQAKPVEEKAKQ
jgi:preprotein translocase subunit SecG